MFKTNEYFDGNVKSLGFEDNDGTATIGIMAPGKYEFGTSQREYMSIISGEMKVMLPNAEDWKVFGPNETFIVEPNKKFQLEIAVNSTYFCRYQDVKSNCGCCNCDC